MTTNIRWISVRMILALGLLLSAVTADAVAQPDRQDGQTKEDAAADPVRARFNKRDGDRDGRLSEEEFVKGGGQKPELLRRDFGVFDADKDGALSYEEFLSVPSLIPEPQRQAPPDPVVGLVERRLQQIERLWDEWDADEDGGLSAAEFQSSQLTETVPDLGSTDVAEWDRDQDGRVSRADVRLVLEIAYGVRRPEGELLRRPSGRVLDWRTFRALDRDNDGFIEKPDYLRAVSSLGAEGAEKRLGEVDTDQDERISFSEWAASRYPWNDHPATFLRLDTNLDGQLERQELLEARLPAGQRPFAPHLLPGFDADGDGRLSLAEYRLTPLANLFAIWYSARDSNDDGQLGPADFRFAEPPALAALTAEFFARLDVNEDGRLDLDEWPFVTRHPKAVFRTRDRDENGRLSEEEFLAGGKGKPERLRRDFRVFDADADGGMTYAEFLSVPSFVPESQRKAPPDPVVGLVEERLENIERSWKDWDADDDGVLSPAEFRTAELARSVPGLALTGVSEWDRDHDGQVSRADVRLLLEIAYGVRRPEGDLLRKPTGSVVDWRSFRALDRNDDGFIEKADFLKSQRGRGADRAAERLRQTDQDEDGRISFPEWAAVSYTWADSTERFLNLDTGLDGQVRREELLAARLPSGQKPWAPYLLPAFDTDGNGTLSLAEYRLTPLANLLAIWHAPRDGDHDGRLGPGEFRFGVEPALAGLAAEFFTRLDNNDDGGLDLDEWTFAIDPARAPREIVFRQRDLDGNKQLSLDEVLGNLKRPKPGEKYDLRQEARLVRIEEAFRRADVDGSNALNLAEFETDAGLEAIAPGASAIAGPPPAAGGASGENATNWRMWAIVGMDAVLLLLAGAFVFRKVKSA